MELFNPPSGMCCIVISVCVWCVCVCGNGTGWAFRSCFWRKLVSTPTVLLSSKVVWDFTDQNKCCSGPIVRSTCNHYRSFHVYKDNFSAEYGSRSSPILHVTKPSVAPANSFLISQYSNSPFKYFNSLTYRNYARPSLSLTYKPGLEYLGRV